MPYEAKTWEINNPITYYDMNRMETQYDNIINDVTAFFSGAILFWSGSLGSIPDGWLLCDGENGTPNLLGQFPRMIPNAETEPASTGGTLAKNADAIHTHTLGTQTDWNLGHYHNYSEGLCSDSPGYAAGFAPSYSTDGSHRHGVTSSIGGSSVEWSDFRPPYIELAFIIKS